MRILKAGVLYFSLVFAAGFLLGSIRVPLLEPRLGARAAELLELPVMLLAIVAAARWVLRRLAVPASAAARLAMGGIALALMLAAEFGLVLNLRGMSIEQYLATRDPVSGTAYYLSLCVFALIPLAMRRL
jgi:hypothetical protein